MGDNSDSKKVSSPYVVLENRPLDQWKVTELKEELKKRKLVTRGLKEELVKRLDEAVRAQMDDEESNLENDPNTESQLEVKLDDADETSNEKLEKGSRVDGLDNKNDEKTDVEIAMDAVYTDEGLESLAEKTVTEDAGGMVSTQVESFKVIQEISVETTVTVTEESAGGSNQEPREGEPKTAPRSNQQEQEETEPGSSDIISGTQVDEVSKVQSDSISIGTMSNIEKNELKDNVIADDVKLEINVKPEMVHPPSTDMVKDNNKLELQAVEADEEKDISNEKDNVNANDVKVGIDVESGNDSGDVGDSEKLNLDRSSGDDSMEEDALESKQFDSKFGTGEMGNESEKIEVKENDSVNLMVEDATADKGFETVEDKAVSSVISTKRKPHDQEKASENIVIKRQRKWNAENLEVPKQQPANHSTTTTPKGAFQPPANHPFSRSESTVGQDLPKERVVPPSSKTPTTSLRIDNFLRPFTLKAVHELLGKTGTVLSFWMDQIKTHCYVTFASVEEAIETRNAVCNLQWPVNGGRLLMADFVDPQEVKNRVNPPPPSPAPPPTSVPPATMQPSQPSPRLKQQLPPLPPSLPPPPPLANLPPARNRMPPPPPPEKLDPPVVTLDDLFKKTRATPRIYYLPLSDEQVAAKVNAHGSSRV